jgi:hypothetical protein
MDVRGHLRRTETRRGVSKGTPRRRLVALALVAIPAAVILVGAVLDRHTPRTLAPPRSLVSASQPIEAASTPLIQLSASTRDASLVNIERDDAVDAALGEFERAFQAASEDELDLIAAERLRDIVRRDPRKTARFIELQSPSQRREVLIRHFSRIWGESDTEAALAWAQALPDAHESNLARRAVCLSLSQTNPAAAVERCAENDAEGQADLQGIFQAWAESDPTSAGEWLDAQPASARLDRLRQRYVHVLAKTNPRKALRMTEEGFTVPADRDEAVVAVLHQWGLQDPNAARDWVGSYAADELKARALAEIEGIESYAVSR